VVAGIALMDSKKKVTISWSGGKDSAFALYKILTSGEYDVVHLHTVINEETRRVGLHGVHESLIDRQALSIGIPLKKIYLPGSDHHGPYESSMRSFYAACAREGVAGVVFGDIFLEDLRAYCENLLRDSGLEPLYPLWKINSLRIVEDFINLGFKTLLCSADAALFSEDQVGRTLDEQFVALLQDKADPCGENGEFHTFVYDGPVFKAPLEVTLGDVVKKVYSFQRKDDDGGVSQLQSAFWFQDLRMKS
jgi:uncharacterized protein (TIGR00290 family)